MGLMERSGLVSYVGKVNMDREATEALKEDSAEMSAYTTFGWINAVKGKLRDAVSHFVYEKTKRSPMILPIIVEI